MNVDIYRKIETSQSITGEFWIEGIRQCFYLEPSRLTPFHPGHPCIPAGRYEVILTLSPHLGYVCPEVLNVPGRTAIRWHIGNFPKEVLGCCVVGTELGENFVGNSRAAFDALMAKLHGQEIVAEYHDPEPAYTDRVLLKPATATPALESGVESAIREFHDRASYAHSSAITCAAQSNAGSIVSSEGPHDQHRRGVRHG